MVALSLWKVVICWDFIILMDGSLVITEASSLLIFCYSNGEVALSLLKVVCCWDFGTLIDGILVITEASSLLTFCFSNGW